MRKTNAATGSKLLGLYLHIPFCVKKCAYCDFYSITDASLKADYTAALIRDIKAYGERCSGYMVDTVYIGGGTPTCLGAGSQRDFTGGRGMLCNCGKRRNHGGMQSGEHGSSGAGGYA